MLPLPETSRARLLQARALQARLEASPGEATPDDVVELARLGLGDLGLYERLGADGVGTDAYPALRDAVPALRITVERGSPDARRAAAYALAFVFEHLPETAELLARRAGAETDTTTKASITLALARTRATLRELRPDEKKWKAKSATGAEDPILGAVAALEVLFDLPDFPREITPEVAAALDAAKAAANVGPWGGGDLGALIAACRKGVWIEDSSAPPTFTASDSGEDADDDGDDDIGEDEVEDPYSQRKRKGAAPRVVLAGLRDIDWRTLEHAYGDARGVPGMIDALSSPEAEDRQWALEALSACIHHQGSVYSASTAATPFLIALLDHAEVEVRPEILTLLCGMAVYAPDEFLLEGARERRSEAYDAVLAGGPTYVRLLGDADARVRTGAAYVLGYCDPPPVGALDALRAAIAAEPDRRARASATVTLGYVARYAKEDASARSAVAHLESWLEDETPLIRAAAAIALLQATRDGASTHAREVAAHAVRDVPRVHPFYPWADGDVAEHAKTLLASLASDEELWAALDAALAPKAKAAAKEAAHRASVKLFGKLFVDDVHGDDRPWTPRELDAPRRRWLQFQVDTTPKSKDLPRTSMAFWSTGSSVGLFVFREALLRVLGHDAGPLDEVLEIEGEAKPGWAFFRAAMTDAPAVRDALARAVAAKPGPQRFAWIEDVLDAPFRLTSSPWHVDWGRPDDHPRSSRAANDYTSSALLLLADIAGTDEDAIAWATKVAHVERERAPRRDEARGVLAALVLARDAASRGAELDPSLDVLLGFDRPPASTYRRAIREALQLLPVARASALVLSQPLYRYFRYIDPRGEVRRWENGDGWGILDLAPPEVVAREVLAALVEWERHRKAGDDRHATPTGGSRKTTIHEKPSPDQPFPRARALTLLRAAGAHAIAAIDALADGAVEDVELLRCAKDPTAQLTVETTTTPTAKAKRKPTAKAKKKPTAKKR